MQVCTAVAQGRPAAAHRASGVRRSRASHPGQPRLARPQHLGNPLPGGVPRLPALVRPLQARSAAPTAAYQPFQGRTDPGEARTLQVPINFYEVLDLKGSFGPESINVACDDLLRGEPTVGYSREAMIARDDIVNTIRETLTADSSRSEYDACRKEDELVEIPYDRLAGCLALMQEFGDMDTVVSIGTAFLRDREAREYRADTALAVALAHCETGRKAMARNPPQVAKGCELLETALKLLQEEGGRTLAPDLQEQIDSTLEAMAPRCALELLSLPVGNAECAKRREEGLSSLRVVLWGLNGDLSPGVTDRAEFMNTALQYMTAGEQVSLFQDTPNSVPAEPTEVYGAALAHIAEGLKSRRPRLIQDADMLLGNLEAQRDATSVSAGDTSLERGMCAMLLGHVEDAQGVLGIKDGSGDPGITDFVLSNSPSPDDVLPGIYLLTERWVREALLPKFRDTQGESLSLSDWFEDPRVQRTLDTLDKGLVGRVFGAVGEVGSGLGSALGSMFRERPDAPPEPAPRGPIRQKVILPTEPPPVDPAAAAASVVPAPVEKVEEEDKTEEAEGGVSGEEAVPTADTGEGGEKGEGAEAEDEAEEEGSGAMVEAAEEAGEGEQAGAAVLGAADVDLFGTRQEEEQEGGSGLGVGGWAAAILGGIAVIALALSSKVARANPRLAPFYDKAEPMVASAQESLAGLGYTLRGERVPAKSADGKKAPGAPAKKPATMDKVQAERIVRQWQSVKAAALGSGHNVALLDTVLEGPMLTQWRSRAVDVKSHGWYWEYNLVGLKIDKVECNEAGTRAMVEATLQEAAQLYDQSKPDNNDSYRSTYCARYEILRRANGWRIVGGQVLY